MNFSKWGFVGLLSAAFVITIGAVELGRNQPTERISGGVSPKFEFFCFPSNFFHQINSVDLVGLVLFC